MSVHLLAISGSLRAVSTNTALLKAAALFAPANVAIETYDGLGTLPHFNPDLDVDPLPPTVAELRTKIGQADGVLISSPEYARGIPGSLKNALDWLVSSSEFPDKPVALFHASARGVASQAALRLVLDTMSARVIDAACITMPLLGTEKDAHTVAANPEYAQQIAGALKTFVAAIER